VSRNINELRRNNTTGVPCIALNKRKGYQVIDVTCYTDRRRHSTSFLVKTAGPITAVARAMFYREQMVGAKYDLTPRQAWERLKKAADQRVSAS
jgi:hypothetical protein